MSKIIKIGVFVFSLAFVLNLFIFKEVEAKIYCNNGPSIYNSGDCGTACGFGNKWSKYYCNFFYGYCWAHPGTEYYGCIWFYECGSCSTADKCISGEKGLRYGDCDCGSYQSSCCYKKCCKNVTNEPVNCAKYPVGYPWGQDGWYPNEGWCDPSYSWKTSAWQNCPSSCTNECSYSGQMEYRCSGNDRQARICLNWDADPCLE